MELYKYLIFPSQSARDGMVRRIAKRSASFEDVLTLGSMMCFKCSDLGGRSADDRPLRHEWQY